MSFVHAPPSRRSPSFGYRSPRAAAQIPDRPVIRRQTVLDNTRWSRALQPTPNTYDPRGPTGAAPAEDVVVRPKMHLWAMDAWVPDETILTDRRGLRDVMYDAASLGGLTVLGERFCVFDNSAVTGVLVLAQSHLSLHTWPEYGLANVDLLSYGRANGEDVLHAIGQRLGARRVNVACVVRGLL
jgi:S-adenosylmethionine decarboxylase